MSCSCPGDVGSLVVGVEKVVSELGEISCAEQRLGVYERRGKHFDVAVLAGMEVEHELGEGAFEAGAGAEVDDEARAGDLGSALEVEDAELFAELPVGLGGERKLARLTPGLDDLIVVLGSPSGDVVGGEIGERLEECAELCVELGSGRFKQVGTGLQSRGLLADGGGVPARALEFRELLRQRVALRFQGFEFGDGAAALGVEGGKALEKGGVGAAEAQFFFNPRQVGPHISQVKHGCKGTGLRHRASRTVCATSGPFSAYTAAQGSGSVRVSWGCGIRVAEMS